MWFVLKSTLSLAIVLISELDLKSQEILLALILL